MPLWEKILKFIVGIFLFKVRETFEGFRLVTNQLYTTNKTTYPEQTSCLANSWSKKTTQQTFTITCCFFFSIELLYFPLNDFLNF